jgi:tetratricopeptide (TPR) repeat protein
MPLTLPADLVREVREGRAVLFLGAGASIGARSSGGDLIPAGDGLATILREAYLDDSYKGLDFRSIYDLCCSVRSVPVVQRKVFEVLNPFQPAEFHRLIPTFAWAGLAGTNYDLVIERAYSRVASAVQRVEPHVKDGDGATDRLSDRSVLYLKLHGCLTRHNETKPPMLASTEQLIAFKDGRHGQFSIFLEWAKTRTLIFCGYAFLDPNLRALFGEIIKEGDNRPLHYIFNKGLLSAQTSYWRERRVSAIDATFEDLLSALDGQITKDQRSLGAIAVNSGALTSFTRFISHPNLRESEDLKNYLSSFIDHVGPEISPSNQDSKRFYSGFDLGWHSIAKNLDVRQPIIDELLTDHILALSANPQQPLVMVKGHAGAGKTIVLRRACYEAAKKHECLCFFVSREHLIQVDRFEEIFRLTNKPIFLFVDNIAEHRDRVLELIEAARGAKATVKIIGTETFSTWNSSCDDLEQHVSAELELRYLSEDNLNALISKLEQHDCLGYLKPLTAAQRLFQLQHIHGRQLLVALLEATHGVPLAEIVAEEYRAIPSAKARLLYLDICSLHRFGPPVRAGLISRLHDISFLDFENEFFKPLQAIVVLRKDTRSGDYVYEARHSHIAHTVYEAVLKTQDQRFDNIVRIIGKLNSSYSYDLEVIAKLVKADSLQRAIADHGKIRQVYAAATEALGERALLLHQRGIFEMRVAATMGELAVAEDLISKAAGLEPGNRSIKHSLSEIDLRRSRISLDRLERKAWRWRSVAAASALVARGKSPYPHHTLLKAAIDGVRDALEDAEHSQTDATTQELGESIAEAEAVLKRGLQAFPNEAILLGEEGELSKVLSEAVRAEKAFEKAFDANQRSTLIAKRLSRIKRSKALYPEAEAILQKCLEFNPSDQGLHYDMARAIRESAPDADTKRSEILLYHYRRSFSLGDKNYQAQFWYARQLALSGSWDDAKEFFQALDRAYVPFREKRRIQGVVLNENGEPRQYSGSIALIRETYGFLTCAEPQLRAFFTMENESVAKVIEYLSVGSHVSFELGFSLRGAVVVRMIV